MTKPQTSSQLKVGVIGTGTMGQRHCRVFSTLRGVELAGTYDADTVIGQKIANQYSVPFYSSIDDLLTNVDAVSVAVPTPVHFELAMRCLERGVHVLVEKPITATLEQAQRLTETAEKSDLIMQVGHIERFNPTYIELTHVLENRQLATVNFQRLSAFESSNTDVDVVLDLMIHDIDLMLHLVGQEPIDFSAQGLSVFSNTIDHATVQFRFERGPLLNLTASRITEQKIRCIQATSLDAYIEANLLQKSIMVHRRTVGEYLSPNQAGVKYRQESIVEYIHVPAYEPLFLELEHFIKSILDRTVAPQVPARDGYKALKIAFDIRDAINQRLVHIKQPVPELTAAPLGMAA